MVKVLSHVRNKKVQTLIIPNKHNGRRHVSEHINYKEYISQEHIIHKIVDIEM